MSENASLSFPLHVISLRKHKPPANAFIKISDTAAKRVQRLHKYFPPLRCGW